MTPEARFLAALQQHQRVVIAGVPGAGKTTLANSVRNMHERDRRGGFVRHVIHTDDYIDGRNWDDPPKRCAEAVPPGPVIIEGVRALAVLRYLKEPVTCVIWLDTPRKALSAMQQAAAKGRRTNFEKWLREDGGRTEVVRL